MWLGLEKLEKGEDDEEEEEEEEGRGLFKLRCACFSNCCAAISNCSIEPPASSDMEEETWVVLLRGVEGMDEVPRGVEGRELKVVRSCGLA